ncbi:MAG TPA: thioredoxin domain-containing protein [Clostridiales bacterium]|nr:thioredoxin domain-containing protein [Clostridiales bacterium]HQP69151.1 thioredoxin domain-containing protein [Clostridiales bacterium]
MHILQKNISLILLAILALNFSLEAIVKNVNAVEFKKLTESGKGVLLDTRSVPEYNSEHIQNSMLIDLNDPAVKNKLLSLPKDKPLYLYCYSGSRSFAVGNFLARNGYSDIYNLRDGIIDWNRNKFPVVNPKKTAKKTKVDAFTIFEYEKLILSEKVIFIDYYAPWCPPCNEMMPLIDKLTVEYIGKVKVVKINFDDSRNLADRLGIKSVPYFVLFKDGKQIFEKYGKLTEKELRDLFDKYIH